jgi:hypothetical protein
MGCEASQLYLVHTLPEPRDDAGLQSSDEDDEDQEKESVLKQLIFFRNMLCQNPEMMPTY